jgi:hypothetical protein
MRAFAYFAAITASLCWSTATCVAQQARGPATLENLVNADEAQETPAAAEVEAANAGPKSPAGTASRPKDGVQHPDLDKAWAEYDAKVAKAAESIKVAISKQFDAATAKGDLDMAEKWQVIGDKFEKAGEVPLERETKSVVIAALADYKQAKEDLMKMYESVVKGLTMEKKIVEAKAVRSEKESLGTDQAKTVAAVKQSPASRDGDLEPTKVPKGTRQIAGEKSLPRSQAKATKTIDLLGLVDPARDAVQGKWEKAANGGLLFDNTRGDVNGKLEIPLQPPADYDLIFDVEPRGGARHLILYIPIDGSSRFAFVILPASGSGGQRPGADAANIFNVHLRVRGNQPLIAVNGQLVECSFKDTARDSYWKLRNGQMLGLGAHESSFLIHKAGLVEDSTKRPLR